MIVYLLLTVKGIALRKYAQGKENRIILESFEEYQRQSIRIWQRM